MIELKLKQAEAAEKIQISEDCFTFWENERGKPQIQFLKACSRVTLAKDNIIV
jgi:DNA-binding XRE family transcriptional regulator